MEVKPALRFAVNHKINKSTISIYQKLKNNEFTTGHHSTPPRKLTRFEAIDELNDKGDFLKCFINNELVGISFPRPISDSERELYELPHGINIYRPGSIFVKEKYRGMGIAQSMKQYLRKHYTCKLFWVARENNTPSKLAASKTMNVHKTIYFDNEYNPTDNTIDYLYAINVFVDPM